MQMLTPKKRLFSKFILPGILALTAVLSMMLFQYYTVKMVEEQVYQSLSESAQEQTTTLNEIINGRFFILEAFAGGMADQLTEPTLEDLTARMNAVAEATDFVHIAVAGTDGFVHTNDGQTDDSSDRFYMTEALAGHRAVQKLTDSRLYQKNRMVLAVPLYKDGVVAGAVMGSLPDQDVEKLLVSAAFRKNAYSLLCDSTGYVVVHPEKITPQYGAENILEVLAGEGVKYFDGNTMENVAADLQNGRSGLAVYSIDGDKRYAVYQPVGINDWYIFNVVPGEVVEQAINEQNRWGLICITIVAKSNTIY